MNGLCYTIPVDLNVVNIEKFPILVPGSNQVFKLDPNTTIIIHGMATMGWSAHYTATVSVLHIYALSVRYNTCLVYLFNPFPNDRF